MAAQRSRSDKKAEAPKMTELESILQHQFERPFLLALALTHRSYVYDAVQHDLALAKGQLGESLSDARRDNEQMEFLGDAVLGLLVAEFFCQRFPASREGELTRLRASVVSRKHLGEVGQRLDLGRWLRVGRTLEHAQDSGRIGLLSNAIEAIVAALYLDGGLQAARRFIEDEVLRDALPMLERFLATEDKFSGAVGDFKSALQEYLQGSGMGQPDYRLVGESGPAHNLIFRVGVWVDGKADSLAEADGSSKKQAQQEAARLALLRLRCEGLDEAQRG